MLLIKGVVEKTTGGGGCAWKVKTRLPFLTTCYMVETVVVYVTYFTSLYPYKTSVIIILVIPEINNR